MHSAVAAALLLWLPAALHAQVLYGSLTGIARRTVTDERGVYAYNDLQAGTYRMSIATPAFATFPRDGIRFRTFRKARINMQFRWEAFNVTNMPAFGNPGATVSPASRNADGTVKSDGGRTEITSASATERPMRSALRISF
jgi:hypothetical protein